MFDILIRELLAFVLTLTLPSKRPYTLSQTNVIFRVDSV